MKRLIYVLCAGLMLSLLLNVKYELSSHLIRSKVLLMLPDKDAIVIKECQKVPEEHSRVESAWLNCLMKLNIHSDIVFYGDSHTRYSDFRQFFPELSITNLGCNGDDVNDLIRRIEMLEQVHPRKIFFMGGINGSASTLIETYRLKYDVLFTTIKKRIPDAKIYIESLLPLNPRAYDIFCSNEKVVQINRVLSELAEKHNLVYIDLFSVYSKDGILPMDVTDDGIHLKLDCYDKWAEAIKPYVYE